jgi:hypothetical protein
MEKLAIRRQAPHILHFLLSMLYLLFRFFRYSLSPRKKPKKMISMKSIYAAIPPLFILRALTRNEKWWTSSRLLTNA